jgi:hypothetical protein
MTFDQSGFDVRCEWGENGVRHLAPGADVEIASVLDVSESAPTLVDGAYINQPI